MIVTARWQWSTWSRECALACERVGLLAGCALSCATLLLDTVLYKEASSLLEILSGWPLLKVSLPAALVLDRRRWYKRAVNSPTTTRRGHSCYLLLLVLSDSIPFHSIHSSLASNLRDFQPLSTLLRSTFVLRIPQSGILWHARHARLEAGPHLPTSRVDILVLIIHPWAISSASAL